MIAIGKNVETTASSLVALLIRIQAGDTGWLFRPAGQFRISKMHGQRSPCGLANNSRMSKGDAMSWVIECFLIVAFHYNTDIEVSRARFARSRRRS